MKSFTTGRDYRPGFFWGTVLPPNAVYVRLIVVADDYDQAAQLLLDVGAPMYVETLRDAEPLDLPVAAIGELAARDPHPSPHVCAIVRTDEDPEGRPYAVPRFTAYVIAGDGPHLLGRVRVVSMSRPADPDPVARVVPDDDGDDAVVMPEDREGPVPADDPVSTAVAYPTGPLGAAIRQAEVRLPREIIRVRDQLDELLNDLALSRRTGDPRQACQRGADRLRALAQVLGDLHADAQLIEVTLRAGN